MYSKETLSKTVKALKEQIEFYKTNPETLSTVVSDGNRKIGNTLNVSLAPVITCSNCSGCMSLCYDIKAVNQYKNVLNARAKNTALALVDMPRYFDGIRKACEKRKTNKYFRFHVSGDILNYEYFENMIQIAREFPEFRFWTYTKAYHIVNRWCTENGKGNVPENLSIMFSEWRGMPMVNPFGFPEFRIVFKDEEKPKGVKWCCGNCNECIRNNSHCVKGETVYCMEH